MLKIEEKIKNIIIAGVDDATKCPCIGSIFVAGVVADQKTIAAWKKQGVDDSKRLTRKKRDELAKVIKETAHAYAIHEIEPAMIDNKALNLNEWEMAICLRIVHDLLTTSDPVYAYIDNWEVNPILFWERMQALLSIDLEPLIGTQLQKERIRTVQYIPEHQADEKYIVVGAASILAKTSSDAQYDQYKQVYGDFGSGNPGDPATRAFVWKHRHNPPPIIRKSWQTFKVLSQLDDLKEDPLYLYKEQKKGVKQDSDLA